MLGYLLTAAFVWAVAGSAYRLIVWARTPSTLPMPLTPAPTSRVGVVGRLLLELLTFRALARADRTTWLASLAFHYGLLLILIMHLRFVWSQLPPSLVPFIGLSGWATLMLIIGLSVLLIRRIVIDRLRYISSPSDYLHIILLLTLAASGTAMKRLWPVDLYGVSQFLQGALRFSWQPLPESLVLVVHLSLVLLLLFVFPISKLLHGIGIVFSPTLNQRDAVSAQTRVLSGSSHSKTRE